MQGISAAGRAVATYGDGVLAGLERDHRATQRSYSADLYPSKRSSSLYPLQRSHGRSRSGAKPDSTKAGVPTGLDRGLRGCRTGWQQKGMVRSWVIVCICSRRTATVAGVATAGWTFSGRGSYLGRSGGRECYEVRSRVSPTSLYKESASTWPLARDYMEDLLPSPAAMFHPRWVVGS